MATDVIENIEDPLGETPEDVAILYSWANLHGAKYRDFSASRREYRAQVRHRAAEELRQSELAAKAEAEAAATDAERIAREAERAAHSPEAFERGIDRESAIRDAETAARRAAAERVEAARRAEAAALAEVMARREEREIAEAHASAQRQAARYAESETRRRHAAGPQPRPAGLQSDPYEFAQGSTVDEDLYTPNRQIEYTQASRIREAYGSSGASGERRAFRPVDADLRRRPQGFRPDEASGLRAAYGAPVLPAPTPVRTRANDDFSRMAPAQGNDRAEPAPRNDPYGDTGMQRGREDSTPAWLFSGQTPAANVPVRGAGSFPPQGPLTPIPPTTPSDTLQLSRERVASRWYALKGVFEPGQEPVEEAPQQARQETRTPVLAVFSLAGGVGKTSLVATLGRALSSLGEKVLLADTTSQGLLPYYFGASELKAGVVRTFSPPSGSTDAPIYLVSYDVDPTRDQDRFSEQLGASAGGTHRVLMDLNGGSGWVIRRLADMVPTVLVPVAPDMNSVISLQAVERYFTGAVGADGRAIQPYYVINQFDPSLPLHLDVREVLRRQLGERLLPIVIRRSPAVSEALAEGMTVVDYAPEDTVTEDYMNIANWARSVAAPATQGFRNVRWSER